MDESPEIPPSPSPPPPPLPAGPPPVSDDEKTMAMLCHLLAIFTGFLGPLILWLVRKDTSPFIDHHGRESLNFQITFLIVMFALGCTTFVLMFVFIGILLVPVLMALGVFALVAEILAAVAASQGAWHRYPFCIRFV